MPKVFKTVQGNTKSIAWIVQECMRQAEKDDLKVFGIRNGVQCVTTKWRHYNYHGSSHDCNMVSAIREQIREQILFTRCLRILTEASKNSI